MREVNPSLSAVDNSTISATPIRRRTLLQSVFWGLGAASLPAWVVRKAQAQPATNLELSLPFGPLGAQDYGPLVEQVVMDPLSGVQHQLFAPEGFDVRVVMRAGVNPLTGGTSGTLGHVSPDGGAVYPSDDGGWVYVSNSETSAGGVSSLRFDAAGTLIDYYRICTGTRTNCAGGQTPWGTWITCEEVTGGWAYECDPFGSPASQRRLDALGARNGREAVAIDPMNHVCYQTLDTSSGKFVRFVSDASDLEVLDNGVTRMRFEQGVSQRLLIPAFGSLVGYNNVTVPNNATGSAAVRLPRPIEWVADAGSNGTNFNGGEGIWYYEVPEALRTIPEAGSVPTRGVIFFASKGDNRVWAIDIENSLIELIYDTHNGQAFTNLRNANGSLSNYNQVDNCVVSPAGDVLVAEDGTAMRLAIVTNGAPAKLLMQITRGGSEICGPAFTRDGSRLYFSSQRGPSGPSGTSTTGVIYEMTIPPRYRSVQRADAFQFPEELDVAPAVIVTSEPVVVSGFIGPLWLTLSGDSAAEYSLDGGSFSNQPTWVDAGQELRVRHSSASVVGGVAETWVTVGLPNGAAETTAGFFSVTSEPDMQPDPFDFGTRLGVPGNTLVESDTIRLSGFNLPTQITCGPRAQYRIDGGAWTNSPGTLAPKQTLQMRHVSNRPSRSVRTTLLIVGGVAGQFVTRTA